MVHCLLLITNEYAFISMQFVICLVSKFECVLNKSSNTNPTIVNLQYQAILSSTNHHQGAENQENGGSLTTDSAFHHYITKDMEMNSREGQILHVNTFRFL